MRPQNLARSKTVRVAQGRRCGNYSVALSIATLTRLHSVMFFLPRLDAWPYNQLRVRAQAAQKLK